jgi:hypothetical protein
MKSSKRFISFILIVLMIAGLSLTGHAAGYSISGTVTSYGDAAAMTVLRLIPEDSTVAIITQTVTGNQATYQLANVPYGSYTMTVQKEGHVTRTYPVTIDSTDAYLDVKVCPLGDVSGNGKVNMGDVSTAYAHSKRTALLTDSYKLACGDLNKKYLLSDKRVLEEWLPSSVIVSPIFRIVKEKLSKDDEI